MKNRYKELQKKLLNEDCLELIVEANIDKDRLAKHFLEHNYDGDHSEDKVKSFVDWFWSFKPTKQAVNFNILNPQYWINSGSTIKALVPILNKYDNNRQYRLPAVPVGQEKTEEKLFAHFTKFDDYSKADCRYYVNIYLNMLDKKILKPINPLDINYWIKSNIEFNDFYNFFYPYYKKSLKTTINESITVRAFYEEVLDADDVYNYNNIPPFILDRLLKNQNFDGQACDRNNIVTDRGYSILHNDNNWLVVCPHNEWSSRFFGKMVQSYDGDWASWCTCKYLRNMYWSYAEYGFQYIIIDKVNKTKYNIQFSNRSGGNKQTIENSSLKTGEYDRFPGELINKMFIFENTNNTDAGKKNANIKDFAETLEYNKYKYLYEITILKDLIKFKIVSKVLEVDNDITALDKLDITPDDLKKYIDSAVTTSINIFRDSDYASYKNNTKDSIVKNVMDKYDSNLYIYLLNALITQMKARTDIKEGAFSAYMIDYIIDTLNDQSTLDICRQLYIERGYKNAHRLIYSSDTYGGDNTVLSKNENVTDEQFETYTLNTIKDNIKNLNVQSFEAYSPSLKNKLIGVIANISDMYRTSTLNFMLKGEPNLLTSIINSSELYKKLYADTNLLTMEMLIKEENIEKLSDTDQRISIILNLIVSAFVDNKTGGGYIRDEYSEFIKTNMNANFLRVLTTDKFNKMLDVLSLLNNVDINRYIKILAEPIIVKYINMCILKNNPITSEAEQYVTSELFELYINSKINSLDKDSSQELSVLLFNKFKDTNTAILEQYIKAKMSKKLKVSSHELQLCDRQTQLKYIESLIVSGRTIALDLFEMCPVALQHLYVLNTGYRNISGNYYNLCKIIKNPDGTEKANLKLYLWRDFINNDTLPVGYLQFTTPELFAKVSEYFYSKDRSQSFIEHFKKLEETMKSGIDIANQ